MLLAALALSAAPAVAQDASFVCTTSVGGFIVSAPADKAEDGYATDYMNAEAFEAIDDKLPESLTLTWRREHNSPISLAIHSIDRAAGTARYTIKTERNPASARFDPVTLEGDCAVGGMGGGAAGVIAHASSIVPLSELALSVQSTPPLQPMPLDEMNLSRTMFFCMRSNASETSLAVVVQHDAEANFLRVIDLKRSTPEKKHELYRGQIQSASHLQDATHNIVQLNTDRATLTTDFMPHLATAKLAFEGEPRVRDCEQTPLWSQDDL